MVTLLVIMGILLFFSVASLVILVVYVREVVENLKIAHNNIDQLQKLLDEYVTLLAPVAEMENYYKEPAITAAVKNTKLVIDVCKVFKTMTTAENYDETQENPSQETFEDSEAAEDDFHIEEEAPRKAEATISKVG